MRAGSSKQRKALHAYVTEESHDLWHSFAAEQGASVSAILESLAPTLTGPPETPYLVQIEQVIAKARGTDASRRRRRSSTNAD